MSESEDQARRRELGEKYRARAKLLQPVAKKIEALLLEHLKGIDRIDRVTTRVKGEKKLLDKACKRLKDGSYKYVEPLTQIQDQIGARVVTFYLSDVNVVSSLIGKYYTLREEKSIEPSTAEEFGYFGRHFIINVPSDAVPEAADSETYPPVFELQIKTLFQHAWSEAEHDLGYKPETELDVPTKRLLAFAGAQAWGADNVFEELFSSLNAPKVEMAVN